jgi:NitT/TauT family transport system substrate-binding protein
MKRFVPAGPRRVLVIGLAIAALLLAACGGAAQDTEDAADAGDAEGTQAQGEPSADEEAAEPVTVRFAPTAPLPIYWPYYYVADALGFYEEEGIEVEFVNAQVAVQQALLAGRLDVSGTGLDYIPQAPTFDDPPKWYMNVDKYLWVMVTLADSEFQTAQDLQGGKIGINEPHDTLDAEFLMGAAGVPQGEYELIPVGQDRAALVALERGEIDAFVTAGAVSVAALKDFTDSELRVIENPVAEDYYNTGNMVTVDQLENERDVAVRFGRAVAKGMIWTWENPQTTGELVYEMIPESAESAEQAVALVEAGNEANRASYEDRGRMELDIYQDMVDTHAELGLIDESYDANILFTNDLIDDIWDFDVEAEIEAARNDER